MFRYLLSLVKYLLKIFDWSVVDFWVCVNFCCTAKWLSYTEIYVLLYILFHYGLSQDIKYTPVLYNRTLLFIHSRCNNWHLFCCLVTQSHWFQLFVTPCAAAHQASLSFTVSQTLFELMSIESMIYQLPKLPVHPSLSQSLGNHKSVLYVCESVSV